MENKKHCGYIGIIGRPNVGKSTLLNSLLQKKLVITSDKAQTTRHAILGIKTLTDAQLIYVDTPGYRHVTKKAMHRHLNKAAGQVLHEVDVLAWVVDATQWTQDDDAVLKLLKHIEKPVLLVLNKVDKVKLKDSLLPLILSYREKHDFVDIVPLSALKEKNIEAFEQAVKVHLPAADFMYAEDQLTDRDNTFIFSEMVREPLMQFLGQELPYSTTVQIEKIEDGDTLCKIYALILVERPGQKAIVIGHQGQTLKHIGQHARHSIEHFLGKKVYLQLWVKIKEGWTEDERMFRQLGY
jgi:GTP-binding protein Era